MTHYKCKVCGRAFERKKKKDKHERNCGIVKLSKFGISETVFNKIRRYDGQKGKDSKQLQIGESIEGSCPRCGSRILSSNSYKHMDRYLECPQCEKVVNKNML